MSRGRNAAAAALALGIIATGASPASAALDEISAVGEIYDCGAVSLTVTAGSYMMDQTVTETAAGTSFVGRVKIRKTVTLLSSAGAVYTLKELPGADGGSVFNVFVPLGGQPTGWATAKWQFKGATGVLGTLNTSTTYFADGTWSDLESGTCQHVTNEPPIVWTAVTK